MHKELPDIGGVSNLKDTELTNEEITVVNNIISGIQADIDQAISKININDFDGAITSIENSLKKSNCPLCKKELGIYSADIIHTKTICMLGSEFCNDEVEDTIIKGKALRNEFIPITTTKKAIKSRQLKEGIPELNDMLITILDPLELFKYLGGRYGKWK